MTKLSISVAIITKNEAIDIADCLNSVIGWTDEIIVVDSGSTDGTAEICRKMGATVIQTTDWPGFGLQKNRALTACRGDWILSLDADETVSTALQEEILQVIQQENAAAFRIPRLSSFCGREMHHSGWWPDYVTRLLRQGCGCFSDDYVHERILVDGETKTLKNSLLHKTMPSLEEAIDKTNQYSTLGIDKLNKAGIPPSFSRAIIKGLWAFIRTYLLRQGFRDGKHGFILAVHNAETTYYKYLKHWLTHEHVHSQRQRLLRQHP